MEFHPISELDAKTSPEVLARARKLYVHDSLIIKAKKARECISLEQAAETVSH